MKQSNTQCEATHFSDELIHVASAETGFDIFLLRKLIIHFR